MMIHMCIYIKMYLHVCVCSYITPNLIAMGLPAEGLSGQYRNNMKDVQRFLNNKHKDDFFIYNLCSELSYDHKKFDDRVLRYGFDDHNPCAIDRVLPLCKHIHSFLRQNKDGVAAIHCKAGKGRTGFIIACYLTYTQKEEWATADLSLKFFGDQRTKNGKGVTIPSQIRYVHYFEETLKAQRGERKAIPASRPLHLKQFCVYSIPNGIDPASLHFTITAPNPATHKMAEVYHSKSNAQVTVGLAQDWLLLTPVAHVNGDGTLCGMDSDMKIKLKAGKDSLLHFWINTRFLPDEDEDGYTRLRLSKGQLDKAIKDKKHERFGENLCVELVFRHMEKLDGENYAETRWVKCSLSLSLSLSL
jgi:phosphatidylinositol-3,4,5-trisphosphate 3-phosphatase/dual-specificity protein phosphatase PTEN